LSNSVSQKRYIDQQCVTRGIKNVEVVTADIGSFDTDQKFDRVASVEMFEHVRNHHQLFANIARWLAPAGQLFVHVFCHRKVAYTFESEGEQNWMGHYFFSGGMMPAEHLFRRYQQDVAVRQQWWINGLHYSRTCQEWLRRLDANESQVRAALASANQSQDVRVLTQRWRMFFMACAEFFKFGNGEEWGVAHYSFVRNDS
jgi:cyclopropane-fatty-acyl-phospholipid synthase